MGGSSTWVQEKIELFEGELLVFKRPNSPNWYYRVWIAKENDYFQRSTKTQSKFEAIERAKAKYKELQVKIAKEEKVFTITFAEALEKHREDLEKQLNRGNIGDEWFKKQMSYLTNQYVYHFGADTKVNSITDQQVSDYIDIRLKRCKRKQTIVQEITIIKAFYKYCLIKGGWVYTIPEFPSFKLKKPDRSKRDDTFTEDEMRHLFKFMIEKWVFRRTDERFMDPALRVRNASTRYGKVENKQKILKDWEVDMEMHRRHMMFYALFILLMTGMRPPSEVLDLKWGDIKYKKQKMDASIPMLEPMTIFGIDSSADYWVDQIHNRNVHRMHEHWCDNQNSSLDNRIKRKSTMGLMEYTVIDIVDGKTGDRTVPGMCAGIFDQIKDYFSSMEEEVDGKLIIPPFDDDQPIFLELFGRRKGKAMDKYVFNRLFRELIDSAGLNRIKYTPYHFRHYFITERIRNGMSARVPQLAKWVGNSPQEIYKTYEHVFLEDDLQKLVQL